MKKLRNSKGLSIFFDAVNIASVALIIAVCLTMTKEVITDWQSLVVALLVVSSFLHLKKLIVLLLF